MRSRVTTAGAMIATVLITGACSTKAADSDGASKGDVKTDVGVDDKEIHLGILTDLSGPYKANGLAASNGTQIWADKVNADGGICGRKIALDVKDHGYKADNAVSLYSTMKDSVLGIANIVGTPIVAALKSQVDTDGMLATVVITGSNALDTQSLFTVTATYDIEAINGLSYLQKEGKLADGDKVGVIYLDNEAGQNTLSGVKHYGDKHSLDITGVPVSATDTDMTSVVTKMKSEGVKLLVANVSSATIGSVGVALQDQSLDVPILAASPSFSPALVANKQVMDALASHYYESVGVAPYASDGENAQIVEKAYEKMGQSDIPSPHINLGYLSGLAWQATLEQACKDGDLTRAGIKAAQKKVTDIDTGGLSGNLDLSVPGASPTRETFIQQLDPSSPEGLKIVSDRFVSDEANDYKFPNA